LYNIPVNDHLGGIVTGIVWERTTRGDATGDFLLT